jgi:transposase-like protein
MSEFGKTLEESEKRKTSSKVRYSSDYVKITNEHPTTIRVLDDKPEVSWQHFVPKGHHAFPNANSGKGMSFTCPSKSKGCPICAWNESQKAKDPETKDLLKARKIYSFNVLDRTLTVNCPNCSSEYYSVNGAYPEECSECGADLTGVEATPRDKIKIMQKGKRMIDQFKSFEEEPELGDIRNYDIKIDTRGTGSESMTTCVPKQKSKINMKEVVGEDWKEQLFNIKEIVKPLDNDVMSRILGGEDYYSVVKNS